MVDGRFVLKITDYGFNELLESQKAPLEEFPPEGKQLSFLLDSNLVMGLKSYFRFRPINRRSRID